MTPARATLLALAVLLALPALPGGHAGFVDPLPGLSAAVTAVAADATLQVGGHESGQVVAVDAADGTNRWSTRLPGRVDDLALVDGLAVAVQGTRVVALRATNGTVAWQLTSPSRVAALDVEAGQLWAARADGHIVRLSLANGAVADERVTGLDGLTDVDARGGDLLAAATNGLGTSLAGGAWMTVAGGFAHAAWTGTTTGLAIDSTGHLQRFTLAGSLTVQAAATTATLSALDANAGRAVAGDANGLLYPLDAAGAASLPPLATYANAVLDVVLRGDDAVAAFRGGWIGTLRLDRAPVGLLLGPAERAVVPNPFPVDWAYADPDAVAGDQVRHRIAVRPPGGDWQVVATGFSPADPLTRLRTQLVDLASMPSGTSLELRLELIDDDGNLRATTLGGTLLLDSAPPEPAGNVVPAPGERVVVPRPLIAVGHRDRDSGVQGALTTFLLDGQSGVVDWNSHPSFTEFRPSSDLADGTHTWQVTVVDKAGNRLVVASHFVVDTTDPTPSPPEIQALRDALLLRFTTPEPAACTATAGTASVQDALATQHLLALGGLASDTAYDVRLTCSDAGGSTALRNVAARTNAGAAGTGVRLDLATTPSAADGASGFYRTAPELTATPTPPTAALQWALDGGAFTPLEPGTVVPDGEHTLVVLATADGSAAVATLRLKVDASPPPTTTLTLDVAKRLLSWDPVSDPHSGIAGLRIEALVDGEWLPVNDLPASVRESSGLPYAQQARLVATNGAGLTTTSNTVDLPAIAGDELHSTAGLEARTVAADGRVRVRVRLAGDDQGADAVLTDRNGVQRTFSDAILVGPRLVQVSAPASAFKPGAYDVSLRLRPDGETLALGTVTITSELEGSATSTDGATGQATRDGPAPAWAPVALALLGLAYVLRRRTA